MVSNSTIDLVNLDFDAGKQSFITWLQGQARFKDYDFTGSDINVLLDILQVNTFRNGFFLNMAISEGFIDSAQIRTNILSHAKELNYVPRSTTSAYANVSVSFVANGPGPFIIQKGQTFTSQFRNAQYTFSVPENIIVSSPNNQFNFITNIYEGIYVKDSYIFNNQAPGINAYDIQNANVDTTSIVVNVFENSNTVGEVFTYAPSLLGLNGSSKVFFLQTSAVDGSYEILFGDNVLGYQPQNGSLVVIDYRVASGSPPNGAGFFTCNFDPTLLSAGTSQLISSVTVTALQNATAGANIEGIETTRFYAPRWFQAQERAIVPADYEILLQSTFPEITAVNAFGGENLSPAQYGKVYIAVVLNGISGLPDSLVTKYTNYIQDKMALTLVPVFMEPTFVYIAVNTTVKYNTNITTASIPTIQSEVLDSVLNFANTNLDDFNVSFYYSPMCTAIDNSDTSIISNETTVQLYQKITPPSDVLNSNILLNYEVPLLQDLAPIQGNTFPTTYETVLTSSVFTNNGAISYLLDDANGTVNIVTANGTNYNVTAPIGTIDYESGTVQLNNFAPDSFSGNALLVFVKTQQNDITVDQSTYLSIEPDQVNVTVVPVAVD